MFDRFMWGMDYEDAMRLREKGKLVKNNKEGYTGKARKSSEQYWDYYEGCPVNSD